MIADSRFEIGTGHDVCQDYALHGSIGDKFKFAIVADGCSASHDVSGQGDVGARIMGFSTAITLAKLLGKATELPPDLLADPRKIVDMIMEKARELIGAMSVNVLSLDSTVVLVVSDGKKIANIIYGDGVVVMHKKNGEMIIYSASFPSGAPYYMSYVQDIPRRTAYREQFSDAINLSTFITKVNENVDNREMRSASVIDFDKCGISMLPNDVKAEELESISIFSDGIHTYGAMGNDGREDDIPYVQVIKELAVFKSTGTNFVKRRFNKFNKLTALPAKWNHYDDVAIASINFR